MRPLRSATSAHTSEILLLDLSIIVQTDPLPHKKKIDEFVLSSDLISVNPNSSHHEALLCPCRRRCPRRACLCLFGSHWRQSLSCCLLRDEGCRARDGRYEACVLNPYARITVVIHSLIPPCLHLVKSSRPMASPCAPKKVPVNWKG
jgi:hypothetical protein